MFEIATSSPGTNHLEDLMLAYIPPGYTPGALWGHKLADGKIVWACHCACHEGLKRPKAGEAMLCKPCADEAFYALEGNA